MNSPVETWQVNKEEVTDDLDAVLVVEVVLHSGKVTAAIIMNDCAFHGIDDHLAHDGVVVNVEVIVPAKTNDHRLIKRGSPALGLAHRRRSHPVPYLSILFALRPVLSGIVSVHPIPPVPSHFGAGGLGIGDFKLLSYSHVVPQFIHLTTVSPV